MTGIEAGSRRLITQTPTGWILKGVLLNGRDISDLAIDFQEGVTVRDVSVVVTSVKSPLTVAVQHPQENGVAAVVMFPHDRALWHAQSRRTQFRAAACGSCPFRIEEGRMPRATEVLAPPRTWHLAPGT
jgi:hypothetical protein